MAVTWAVEGDDAVNGLSFYAVKYDIAGSGDEMAVGVDEYVFLPQIS